jgi:hypothetical protein
MHGEANCIVCSRARALIALVPVAKGYCLKVYECPCCRSTLRLVTRVTKAALVQQQRVKQPRAETWLDTTTAKIGGPGVHQRFAT